jgi:hypothetical protein
MKEPGTSRWSWVTGILLLALVAAEVAATSWQHRSHAVDADWAAAAANLRELRKGAEPVLVAPQWAGPIARMHLGGLVDMDLTGLSDVDRYARVWQIATRGARHDWLTDAWPEQTLTFGRVTVSRFEQRPAIVLYSFRQRLRDARVSLIGERAHQCPRTDDRFRCDPERPWNWVGPHLAEVDGRPYHCIYAHPVDRHRLRIGFAEVPLGTRLIGYTGIDGAANRREAKASVLLQVFVDSEIVASVEHQNHLPWWRFEVDTARFTGKEHRIRFEVSTERSEHRTFCFHAEARK